MDLIVFLQGSPVAALLVLVSTARPIPAHQDHGDGDQRLIHSTRTANTVFAAWPILLHSRCLGHAGHRVRPSPGESQIPLSDSHVRTALHGDTLRQFNPPRP